MFRRSRRTVKTLFVWGAVDERPNATNYARAGATKENKQIATKENKQKANKENKVTKKAKTPTTARLN